MLALLSFISFAWLLFSRETVSTRLLDLGKLGSSYLGWQEDARFESWNVTEGGLRIVVFGDSWVDNGADVGKKVRGKSWTEVLCDELQCTSYLNFAASPSTDRTADPAGALTSNAISSSKSKIPDFSQQIRKYVSVPPPKLPTEVLFIVSFGIWDIYTYSSLEKSQAEKYIDESVDALFSQLDVLYEHLSTTSPSSNVSESDNTGNTTSNTFRLIVPRLFDTTLLPGWSSQRPLPEAPLSVAEEQKDTVWLIERWNQLMENHLGSWLQNTTSNSTATPSEIATPEAEMAKDAIREADNKFDQGLDHGDDSKDDDDSSSEDDHESSSDDKEQQGGESLTWHKLAFLYDLPSPILTSILEHQLQSLNISDSSGLGAGPPSYTSITEPCVHVAELETDSESGASAGNGEEELESEICEVPESRLWWDGWHLGPRAMKVVGREVADMVREGRTMKVGGGD